MPKLRWAIEFDAICTQILYVCVLCKKHTNKWATKSGSGWRVCLFVCLLFCFTLSYNSIACCYRKSQKYIYIQCMVQQQRMRKINVLYKKLLCVCGGKKKHHCMFYERKKNVVLSESVHFDPRKKEKNRIKLIELMKLIIRHY